MCSVSDVEMKNMCEKSEQEPKIPGAGSVIYFLWTAIVRKNDMAQMLILKNRSL
jgi:hypothetical protein